MDTPALPQRRLGATGPLVSALGLGAMSMSDAYGPADRTESIATVHAALDAGITLIDTGDFYGAGHNELLLREALGARRREVVLSVKFGALRDPAGRFIGVDGRPAAVKSALTYSLQRLGTEYVDVYRLARLDPQVPIEDTVGAVKDLIDEGYVRHVGLSEVGAETIRRAAAVAPVADVQLEYSLLSRGIEGAILPACRALGIGVTAYGVLSRGLLGGHWSPERAAASGDRRVGLPRFQGENLERNMTLVRRLAEVAEQHGLTTAQAAVAWVLAQGEDVVPLIGARTRERLAESLGALAVTLSADDLAEMEAAVPKDAASGTRYDAHSMTALDNER